MKLCILPILAAVTALPLLAEDKPKATSDPAPKKVKLTPLTAKQQAALLAQRQHGGMLGKFNSYASLLFAVENIVVHTDDAELGKVVLNSPFPDFYKPTNTELFDAMARQMGCSWSYDEKRAYWLFAKPAMPMPFKVTLAKGWVSEERGNYLFCKPPTAPIGMDIYVMAGFSAAPTDAELAGKMREAAAMMFARSFKKDVTAKDMSMTKAGTLDALHFKTPTPRPGTTWRQWAVAAEGQVVVIVSAIDDANEKDVLPGVEETLKSFTMKKKSDTPADKK